MTNVLNLYEAVMAKAPWPHELEQETIETMAESMRHYYLLSLRLEARIATLEAQVTQG